jgi:hypothetical protein
VQGIGAFNGNRSHIGLSCLKNHLKSEIDNIYSKNVAPAILALLQYRCAEVLEKLVRLDTKKQAMSTPGIDDALCSFFLYTFGIKNRMQR